MPQPSDNNQITPDTGDTLPATRLEIGCHGDSIEPFSAEVLKSGKLRTVADGFTEFLQRLTPKYTESDAAEETRKIIEHTLERTFMMSYLAPYGSRGHGTNVAGFSAIDGFAVVPNSTLHEDSGKSLKEFRDVLADKVPGVFITQGRPVISVPYGDLRSQRHHVVPAYEGGHKDGHDVYIVPAPRSRWIHICPAAHSIWINDLENRLDKKLKRFIRVVKAWSYYNDDVIWPYYLEHCVADYLRHDSQVVYSHDLYNFFTYLAGRKLAPFEDTAGCNEPVYGTSIADREAALKVVRSSAEMAAKARECEQRGNVADAFYWWRKIFDWRFAAY